MRYVKINLSFTDKLRLLFLGIVPESKLPEVVKLVQVCDEKPQRPPLVELSDEINTNEKEEEFSVPFFNFDDDDTKSNF